MDAETYIGAEQAIAQGFATGMIQGTEKIAAQVSDEWLALLPHKNFPVGLKGQAEKSVPESAKTESAGQPNKNKTIEKMSDKIDKPEAPAVNVADIRAEEKERTRQILAIGDKFGVDEKKINDAIDKDSSVNDFRAAVMNGLDASAFGVSKDQFSNQTTYIDSPEVAEYSVVKAIREQADGNLSGLEKEVSEELTKRHYEATGQAPNGLLLPGEVTHGIKNTQTVDPTTAGGYTVATEVKPIVDILNDMLVLPQLGATFLRDLTGNCQFPLEQSSYTVENLTEVEASTPSDAVFGEATLTPKRTAASTGISKQLLIQSSQDIEAWVRRRIAEDLAFKMDAQAINGDGTGGAPTGILNVAGTTAYAFQVANSLFANMTAMWADLRGANAAISSAQWLSSPTVTADWMGTPKVAGDGAMCLSGDPVSGFRGLNYQYKDHVSIPANEVVFGAWENLIMGSFGGLDLTVDPYSGAKTATVEITANSFSDVAVVRPSAFVVGDDGAVHA
jgi:HK97 family phage major capsid protein